MQTRKPMPPFVRYCLLFALLTLAATPCRAEGLTQKDWMITLVDTLGWSFGLPDEPKVDDYADILSGRRTLHLEAEERYARDSDNVSVMAFRNYGEFSGDGWLHGTREVTDVHLRFTLPIGGEYRISARLRLPGHRFTIDGAVTAVDGEATFADKVIGAFALRAGAHEIVVTLPPGGSLDSVTLEAPRLPAIAPAGGWQPDGPLTWEIIQVTLLQLLQVADLFPIETRQDLEAEALVKPGAGIVDIPHLGTPSGGRWLRAGPHPATVDFPFTIREAGFYDLTVRAMGGPIDITLDDRQDIRFEARPYLDDRTFKALFFPAGETVVSLVLPAGGGVDLVGLARRKFEPAGAAALLGLDRPAQPSSGDLDSLATLLAAFGVER